MSCEEGFYMKIGIGTVQFGIDYGVSNKYGQTGIDEARAILQMAKERGVRIIDTASQYGMSEETIGKALPEDHSFSIVTKTPSFRVNTITKREIELLERTFYRSLQCMNQSSVYGLLLHHCDDVFAENGHLLLEKMNEMKQQGLIQKIGVSVYTEQQIERVLDLYNIDLIQLPINIFDQRLLKNGYLKRVKQQGIEIHARSIFLQGLLLMSLEELPAFFSPIYEHVVKYHHFLRQHGLSALQAALHFAIGIEDIDAVIVGVNNVDQFAEILQHLEPMPSTLDFSFLALDDERMINPANWVLERR